MSQTSTTVTTSTPTPNSVRVTPHYIGILGDDDPIQPGTIAFIFCLLLIISGFAGLMMIYVKNHRARLREFEIELRKRQVLRERERAIMKTEADNERTAKRRLLEEQDIVLRYRDVQGHGGGVYEDSGSIQGSLSPLSPPQRAGSPYSPFSYSGGNNNTNFQRMLVDDEEMEYATQEGGVPLPPPRQQSSDRHSYPYDYGHRGGTGSVLQVPMDEDSRMGVRLFDPDDSHSIQMAPLPRRTNQTDSHY